MNAIVNELPLQAPNPIDQAIRAAALNPEKSFAVSAPAGSGKTGLITQRILALLAICEAPEDVLAITFTRKAAGEMQDRVMGALWQATESDAPNNPHDRLTWDLAKKVLLKDASLDWNILQSPQRLKIQTIDSLCRSITKQLPFASGLGAQPDMLEDSEQAYRMAVRALFNDMENVQINNELSMLLHHLDNDLSAVERLLTSLLAKREQWLPVLFQARDNNAREYLENVLHEVVVNHLSDIRDALAPHASELCSIAANAAINVLQEGEGKNLIHVLADITSLPDASPDSKELWLGIADLLLTNGGTYRARLTKAEGFPAGKENAELKARFNDLVSAIADQSSDFESILHDVRSLPPVKYDDAQWNLIQSLTKILPVLVAHLTLVFKQNGATDYTAISQAALQALNGDDVHSDIFLQMDHRIRHILVDEFQDTSTSQLNLLIALTKGWEEGDGRTLFIVGDGMQSCYGFRSANVGIFLDARRQGIGAIKLEALDLAVNFRSQAALIEWNNLVFKHAFPLRDDVARGAVSHLRSEPFKPALEGEAAQVHICTYSTEKSQEEGAEGFSRALAQQEEATVVLNLVKTALQENPEGNIAVLVRTRNHLEYILPELSAAGLIYQATEIDRLSSRMAINDLLSLTKALLNPADRVAWLAMLRSPWCGLDNADLHALVTHSSTTDNPCLTDNGFPVIWPQIERYESNTALSETGKKILNRVVPLLSKALDEYMRKPLRQWIEGLWISLGGPAALADDNDISNIKTFLGLLEKHERGGAIGDWAAFEQAVDRLYAAPSPDADHRIQIMTIHKSKGLEFDTVIIPGLDRGSRKDDKQLLLWRELINKTGDKQLMLSPLAAIGSEEDALYAFMRDEFDKQQAYEATRLIYVGCTRAIKRLHLVGCLNTKNEAFGTPAKNSLLHCIWPFVKENVRVHSSSPSTYLNGKSGLHHILRLPANWIAPDFSDVETLKEYRGADTCIDELNPMNMPEIEDVFDRLNRHVHDIVRVSLNVAVEQKVIEKADRLFAVRDYIARQTPYWEIQLQQLGWNQQHVIMGVDKIGFCINRALLSKHGQRVFDANHDKSACNYLLMHFENGDFQEYCIDRTFVAKGVRWVIEYNTSNMINGESTGCFEEREMQRHIDRLNRYAKAFRMMGESAVKPGVFFVRSGTFKSL